MKKYEELSKLVQFNKLESKIFLPNEIFSDLINCENIKSSNHIALAYCYIYLTTWLYRYAKYAHLTEKINQKKIKEILGYHAEDSKINYLMKKNGVLEQLEYLNTTTDYPVNWKYQTGSSFDDLDELTFDLLSYWKDDTYYYEKSLNLGKNFKVKYPVRSFTRYVNDNDMKEDYKNGYVDGTFYQVENTHLVPFEVFMFCMTNKNLGCTGFFLWSYIKSKTQIFHAYDISQEQLMIDTKLSNGSLNKYLDILKKHNMIKCIVNQDFVVGLQEKGLANTYYTTEREDFTNYEISYNKRKVISNKEYMKRKEQADTIEKEMDNLLA